MRSAQLGAAMLLIAPLTAGGSAAAGLPAPDPNVPISRIPIREWAQAPQNAAGIVFHPYGDYFEIWDNRRDGIPVQVWYRYANSTQWHRIVSRVHYARSQRNLSEFPNQVVFLIDGHDQSGRFVRSAPSRYRTWGT